MQRAETEYEDVLSTIFRRYRGQRYEGAGGDAESGLWQELAGLGLTRLTGTDPESGGASWSEAAALLRAAAGNAVAAPLAENDLLAGWLLDVAGIVRDDVPRTAGVLDEQGSAWRVPWASRAERITVLYPRGDRWFVADLAAAAFRIEECLSVSGEPRDTVLGSSLPAGATEVPESVPVEFRFRGALARTMQMCGAFETVLEMCVEYTSQREQFGRPLARFQAVQRLVSEIAIESVLARAAADNALACVLDSGWQDPRARFAIAAAKSCAGHAASRVVRNAHQAFGAIGSTYEHDLRLFTLPALVWSADFGATADWDELVAKQCMEAGSEQLWRFVSGVPR